VAVMLIARWDGEIEDLKSAYDKAHQLIGEQGGAPGSFGIIAPSATELSTSSGFGSPKRLCAAGSPADNPRDTPDRAQDRAARPHDVEIMSRAKGDTIMGGLVPAKCWPISEFKL
jgi:hypothetical protein